VGGRQPSFGLLGEDGQVTLGVRATAALVVPLLLAACTGSERPADGSTTPASAEATAPTTEPTRAADPPPAPADGACYRLRYDDAVAATVDRRPVPCREEHTSQTYLVGTLDLVVDGHLLAVDSERVREQVSTTCPARLGSFVGGTVEQQRLTMLRSVWFTPTVPESDLGADWYRCDVIALAGSGELAPLDGDLRDVLTTEEGRDRFGMCGTAEPGTEGFRRVICSAAHSWRAVSTVPFEAGDYPGEEQVRTAGEGPCQDAGRAAADDPLNFRWGYEWPTGDQWRSGRTYGLCWIPA
jgi:hypothetical protein